MQIEPHILRRTVARLIPSLEWRHHGIGVLQAYISEGGTHELRLHLWHPSLVREGIVGQGDAHDHRFDLFSTVIHGQLCETLYRRTYEGDPRAKLYDAWHVENARSAADRGFDGQTYPVERRISLITEERRHYAGSTYHLARRVYHRTEVFGLSITLCEMVRKEGQARLLVPHGVEPVHAFNAHDAALAATQAKIKSVIEEAIAALHEPIR